MIKFWNRITNLSDKEQINWVRIIAVASTLVMMWYASGVWITTKDFPVIPLFDWIPIPQYPFDYIIAIFFFVSQLIYIFYNKRWLGWFLILFYIYLAMVDQNRLQPYFYQSFLTLLAIEVFPRKVNPKKVIYTVMLIFLATYLWSGIHKLNSEFYFYWHRALAKHITFLPDWILWALTYPIPWIEGLIGVGLLFNFTRKFSVLCIVFMHVTIIALLIYLGYGYNVIPWNLQNILSVIILFWSLKTVTASEIFTSFFNKQKALILLFTFILPFTNLFGFWDHLLSYSYFTGKTKLYYVQIPEKLYDKLPKKYQKHFGDWEGKKYAYIHDWAAYANWVLIYPERRCIDYLDKHLRSFADDPDEEGLTNFVVWNQHVNKK